MKRYLFLIIVSSLFAFSSCTDDLEPQNNDNPKGQVNVPLQEEYVKPGIIRVKLTPEAEANLHLATTRSGEITTGISSLDALSTQLNVTKIKRTFRHGGKHEGKMRKAGLHLWYDIYFDDTMPMTRAYNNALNIPEVEITEPILKIKRVKGSEVTPLTEEKIRSLVATRADNDEFPKISSGFNDPLLQYQWHYHNEGILRYSLPGADINLLKAWEIETGKPQVIVAIIDGGIDTEHPDLMANLWVNKAEQNGSKDVDDDGNNYVDDVHGWNFVNNTPNITGHEHGTHVAGTVAAVNNNGIGLCGVAGGNGDPNSGVRLMSCQIFQHNFDKGEEEVVKDEERANTFVYAANNGAVIAQNSWEYGWSGGEVELMPSDKAGIDYFVEHAGTDEDGNQIGPMKGGIVIFATGNSSLNAKVMPASYEKVFSVSSYRPDYKKASYSNYGSWVHVTAPGGEGDYEEGSQVFSTIRMAQYGFQEGTSMACPHASGVAALVVSKFGVDDNGNFKTFTNEDLKNRLINTSNNTISWFNPAAYPMGNGYINAHKALAEPGELAPDRIGDLQANWIFDKVTLSWRVTADYDDNSGKAKGFEIFISEKDLYGLDFNRLSADNIYTVLTNEKNIGETLSLEINTLEPDKTYYISIAAFDNDGNKSLSSTIKGKLIPNRAPVVEGLPEAISLRKKETKEIILTAYDIEGYNWEYYFEAGSPAANITRKGDKLIIIINAALVNPGDYTAELTLTDEQGVSQTIEMPYSIVNYAPQLTKSFENILFQHTGEQIIYNLEDYFIEKDGETISYQAESSNQEVATATLSDNTLTVTSTGIGTTRITVTAKDPYDAQIRAAFDITCRDENREADIYPVPVKQDGILNIRMGRNVKGTLDITFYTLGGVKVHNQQAEIAPDSPAQINIGHLKAGNYQIVIKYKKQEITRNITKL